jgi:predicted Zn-dependent protease
MRPKTVRRLLFLAIAVVLIVGTVVGLYIRSEHRKQAKMNALREEGLALFYAGDYEEALSKLSGYVENPKLRDAETLFAYGKSRALTIDPGNKHVDEGIFVLKEYLNLTPPDTDAARLLEAKHILLDLYPKRRWEGAASEGLKLADSLLAQNPRDEKALRARAVLLMQAGKLEESLEAALAFTEVVPTDLPTQHQALILMHQLKYPRDEVLGRADQLLAQHPDDPRFAALKGLALVMYDEVQEGRALLRKAAATPSLDAESVKLLSQILEHPSIGLFDESNRLLERTAKDAEDPRLRELYIQRLWQRAQLQHVVDELDDVRHDDADADSSLLAYKALSLYQLGRKGEAAPIVDALATRREDPVALCWATALRARFADNFEPLSATRAYKEALTRDQKNGIVQFMLGEAYARLGEMDLAINAWRMAMDNSSSWSLPAVMISQSYSGLGDTRKAYEFAYHGYLRSQDMMSAGNFAVMWYRQLQDAPNDEHKKKLLEFARGIQRTYPLEPQSLPVYVTLLAESDPVYAKAEARRALDPKKNVSLDLLLRLLAASRQAKLGIDDEIIERARQLHGSSHQLALASARDLLKEGKPQEALQLMLKMREQSGERSVEWDLSIAQFREIIGDAKALEDWIRIGNANPESLAIQTAVLDARSPWTNREFIARTIERVYKLAGEEGVTWKLARARFLLTAQRPTEAERAEAITKLNDIVRTSPSLIHPRILLAQALRSVNNPSAAILQLQEAQKLHPLSVEIALELAHVLNAEGRPDDARAALERVTGLPNLTDEQRTRLAAALSQSGDVKRATELLAGGNPTNDVLRRGIQAELLRRQGKIDEAEKLYLALLDDPKLNQNLAIATADFFGSIGRIEQAERALQRLKQFGLPPATIEVIRGTFSERYLSADVALKHYIAATKTEPNEPNNWLQLAGFHMRQGRLREADAAAAAGLANIPSDAELEAMRDAARLLDANSDRPGVAALAEPLSRNPRHEAAVATLKLIDSARVQKLSPRQFIEHIRPLADRYPTFLPVQTLTMQGLLAINRKPEAVEVAARALDAFPNNGDAARQAVAVFMVTGRWNQMLAAAQAWRERSPDQSLQADVAAAAAMIRLNRSLDAIKTLDPYLAEARANPDRRPSVLTTYAQALLRQGNSSEAAALLEPLAREHAVWRAHWIQAGADIIPDIKAAAAWIVQSASLCSADNLNDQALLAQAWYDHSQRWNERIGFDRARKILETLTASSSANPEWHVLLASCAEQTGDFAAAEEHYRKALQINPRLPAAQNNLAYLLYRRDGDMSEARDLALKAVAAHPNIAGFQETLARVLGKLGQHADAAKHYRDALELDPSYVDAILGLADALLQQGQAQEARSELDKIDSIVRGGTTLTADQTKQLDTLRALLTALP